MHANVSHLLAAATVALLIADASPASAQTTFRACRVPSVGAIYMIGVSGAPSACLDPSHVEFQWTEGGGGVPADGSITTAKLANGAVTGAKIAAGAVPNWKAATYFGSPSSTAGTISNLARIGFNAPAEGSVWLQSSGYCNVPNAPRLGALIWGTTATERFGVGHGSWDGASPGNGIYHLTYAVSRTLSVRAGANTYYLNFENLGGGAYECSGTNVLLYTPTQLP